VVRILTIGLAALVAGLSLAVPADATVRTPGYKGVKRAPKTKPAPIPTPVLLAEDAVNPQVLVDNAGTAHIVWTDQNTVEEADITHYCRIKRGARACDATHALVPPQDYAGGNYPGGNAEFSPPRVLASGDDLLIVSYRYPNVVEKPDVTSSGATYLWTSDDGGTTITGPGLVGDLETSGVPALFGPPDSPRVGLISDTKTGGTFFTAISPGKYEGTEANLGANGPDRAYSGSLAVVNDRPVAAFADLADQTYIRAWTGNGNILDQSTWSESAPFPGSEPRLASGPAGLFVLYRPDFGEPYHVRKIEGGGVGRPRRVSDSDGANDRDFFQTPTGRLHAGWVGDLASIGYLRTSTDGRRWNTSRRLARATSEQGGLSALDMAAAPDGGGFAVMVRSHGRGTGTILAAPFGNQLPTGVPGLGSLGGDGVDPDIETTCQEINFGDVRVLGNEGCFLTAATGPKGTKVSEGPLRINGIDFIPDPGVKILINPSKRTIDSTGKVTVQGTILGDSPVKFFHDRLALKIPPRGVSIAQGGAEKRGTYLFNIDTEKLPSEVKGFTVQGEWSAEVFDDGSAKIEMALKLPKVFGGITGEVELKLDNAGGLEIDSLEMKAKQVPIFGVLVLEDFALKYDGEGDKWSCSILLRLPPVTGGPRVLGAVAFEKGKFKEGKAGFGPPYPGVKIAPGVFLTFIGAGFGIDPPAVSGRIGIGVVPVLANQSYAIKLDAESKISFGNPITYEIGSNPKFQDPGEGGLETLPAIGSLFDFEVSKGHMRAGTDGYASLGGEIELDLEAVSVKGELDSALSVTPQFRFGGRVLGQICIVGFCHLRGEALVTDKGIGACITTGVTYGFFYKWGESPLDVDIKGPLSCDLSPYALVPPKKVEGQPDVAEVEVPAGLGTLNLELKGDGGAPGVVLVAPNGETVHPVDVSIAGEDARAISMTKPSQNITLVGVRNPEPGIWRVQNQGGSPPIIQVRKADAQSAPEAAGSVGGGGARASGAGARKRTLTYTATRREGLTVTFVEEGEGVAQAIGRATARRGTLEFTPANGPAGRRTIVAVGEQDGLPRFREEIASYTAPKPLPPGRVRGVRIKRSKGGIVVRWRRAQRAAAYDVRAMLSDGRGLFELRGRRAKRARFRDVPKGVGARVRVVARDTNGRGGKPGRARL